MNTLWQAAHECLLEPEPDRKVELTRIAVEDWCNDYLSFDTSQPPEPDCNAALPAALRLVQPRELPQRSLNTQDGRVALVHAIAHIEYNAINLAWDAIYRFRGLPRRYYSDWTRVAVEEAYHFTLMQQHLRSLGHEYGDLPAHNGLWKMAIDTRDDVLLRMALIPRVLEARGLDVTPGMITRFINAGDERAADILRIILHDEIGHVAIGSRWFNYLCQQRTLDPETCYLDLYRRFFDRVPTRINIEARREAGFGDRELAFLSANDKPTE